MSPRRTRLASAAMLAATTSLGILPAGVSHAAGGGGDGSVHLIAMPLIDVPIVEGYRTTGRMRARLTLRVATPEAATAVETAMPALRESALAAAGEFARLRASPYLPVDAERLSHEMTAAITSRDHAVGSVLIVELSATGM